MKKRLLFICTAIVLLFLCGYAYFEYNNYYPEKFRISSAEASLFRIAGMDSSANCYYLKNASEVKDSNGVFLLALRFGLEYISQEHEWLFAMPHAPWGASGHTDSIKQIDIFLNDSQPGSRITDSVVSASHYAYFKKEGVVALGKGHHTAGARPCFVAQTFPSVNAFVQSYNSNTSTFNFASYMEDYHFFSISQSMAQQLMKYGGKVLLEIHGETKIDALIR